MLWFIGIFSTKGTFFPQCCQFMRAFDLHRQECAAKVTPNAKSLCAAFFLSLGSRFLWRDSFVGLGSDLNRFVSARRHNNDAAGQWSHQSRARFVFGSGAAIVEGLLGLGEAHVVLFLFGIFIFELFVLSAIGRPDGWLGWEWCHCQIDRLGACLWLQLAFDW